MDALRHARKNEYPLILEAVVASMWKTVLLISLMHGTTTFDAWTTNRIVAGYPAGLRGREFNPLLRPFAGKVRLYFVMNVSVVPLDLWLLKRPKSKLARGLAVASIGSSTFWAARNEHLYQRWWSQRRKEDANSIERAIVEEPE